MHFMTHALHEGALSFELVVNCKVKLTENASLREAEDVPTAVIVTSIFVLPHIRLGIVMERGSLQ